MFSRTCLQFLYSIYSERKPMAIQQ